ncbi:hypothetical protein Pelo_17797 [Pelomyxa schiedti]|nr:hypothetical protein Pelo_17797 [Pelomyxa schiedti]
MKAGCASSEGSVVVVVMPDKNVLTWDKVENVHHEVVRLDPRAVILFNFGENEPVFALADHKFDSSPLCVAFFMGANKILMQNGLSESSLKALITSVVEEACTKTPKCCQGIISIPTLLPVSCSSIPHFPQDGSIDIMLMDRLTARSMLWHLLSARPSAPTIQQWALRAWVRARNWPALKELLCFPSDILFNSTIDLGNLSLDCVPPQLEGISCSTLNISGNQIDEIPEWLLHARVFTVNLDGNPLRGLPEHVRNKEWWVIKVFLLFGDMPVLHNIRRLVVVGGPQHLKSGLLKCLMENKLKTKVKLPKPQTKKTTTASEAEAEAEEGSPIIKVHKPFKLLNKKNWTAWELGGSNEDWNTFYPCFFFADSTFMLIVDASLSTNVKLHKMNFWLQQIYSIHKMKSATRCGRIHRPQSTVPMVIIVEISSSGLGAPQSFKNFFVTLVVQWRSKIGFCGCFSVSLADGHGYNTTSSPYSSNILEDITDTLRGFDVPECVPRSWLKLRNHLLLRSRSGGVKTTTAAPLKWSQLIGMASRCGVGRTARRISHNREQEEMRMCFDWLSDVGSIFHFRNSHISSNILFSELQKRFTDIKNEILVLEPAWFTEITSKIRKDVSTDFEGCYTSFNLDPMRLRATTTMLPHLEQTGMTMFIHGKPHASFFLLPDTPTVPPFVVHSFWNLAGRKQKVNEGVTHGCMIDFGFLPVEAFTTVMCSLCNIPGVTPHWFWRDGIVISMKCPRSDVGDGAQQQRFYLLMNRVAGKATQETKVEVAMRTTVDPKGTQIIWKNNPMTTALALLTTAARLMTNQPPLELFFVCPECMEQSTPSEPDWGTHFGTPREPGHGYISHKTIMEAVMTSSNL